MCCWALTAQGLYTYKDEASSYLFCPSIPFRTHPSHHPCAPDSSFFIPTLLFMITLIFRSHPPFYAYSPFWCLLSFLVLTLLFGAYSPL